jgi:putative membrane protein
MGIGTLACGSALADDRPGQPAGGGISQPMDTSAGDQEFKRAFDAADTPDKLFLVCAAAEGNCEMKGAELALRKSQDPQVKQLAQKILDDHKQADQKLQQAAQAANIQIPRGDNAMSQHAREIFEKLNGKDFDQQYVSWVRSTHAKAVNEYQDVAQLAKTQQVKDYARDTLPTLQQHYQQSQQAAVAIGLPSGIEAQPAGARFPGGTGSDLRQPAPGSPAESNPPK